jgi:hypothetical protein
MSDELYSDYVRREPHPRNAVFIEKWHEKLLKTNNPSNEF